MKTRRMDDRVKALAKNMKDLKIDGTTRISYYCLTEREKILYDKTGLIAEKPLYRVKPSDSEILARAEEIFDDLGILLKWHEIYLRRVTDLFVTCFPGLTAYNVNPKVAEWYFKLHFYNFLKDWTECVKNLQKWEPKDVEEWKKDMEETGLINKFYRLPRGWSEEDKRKVATKP